MKIVVPGGNGFVGSHICRIAVEAGHTVIAFGRSGAPDLTPVEYPWVGKVDWRTCDVFDVASWKDALDGADAVIHCVGTIQQDPEHEITFDRVNGESALVAAEATDDAGVGTFVLLSIQDKPPFVSGRFLASKRRPERTIVEQHPSLRSVFLRPNLIYGRDRPPTTTIAALLETLGRVVPIRYGQPDGRPLPVDLVAATAVHAAETDTLRGALNVNQIADIGRTSGHVDPDALPEPSLAPLLIGLGGVVAAYGLLRRFFRGASESESSDL